MSSSNDNVKLIATATAAAAAGAAIAYGLMRQASGGNSTGGLVRRNSEGSLNRRSGSIYEDPDLNPHQSSSNLLFPHNHEEKMRRRIAARVAVEEDNMTPRDSVTVKVPASSANMGPGCKCYLETNFMLMLKKSQCISFHLFQL
jgi:homoserine kinase